MSCYTVKWFGMALMKALVFSVHMYEGTDSDMHAQPFLRWLTYSLTTADIGIGFETLRKLITHFFPFAWNCKSMTHDYLLE